MLKPPLPIDDSLELIRRNLTSKGSLVLTAETGSGKTTRVPSVLLDDPSIMKEGSILMLEPRRLAARSAASWIARQRQEPVGDRVGYEVRFDRKISARTRLKIVTEGVAIRMLQADPFLEATSVVIFDEFHERSLDADLALAMVRKLQQEARPELKILVMSATIDCGPISDFLGQAPILQCPGKIYPVEIHYLGHAPDRHIVDHVASELPKLLASTHGDILVFLPGVGEIHRTAHRIESIVDREQLAVFKLFGDMPLEEQEKVLAVSPKRKVVLSTNVAETSLTIDGITAVLDSGLARELRHDTSVGLDRLTLKRISKASAKQRAGRAGRLGPGVCWRLWSETEHRRLADFDVPAVKRVELASAVLQLRAWGESDVRRFAWFDPPAEAAISQAEEQLQLLNATDTQGLTAIGKRMSQLPIAPRLARLLLESSSQGCVKEAALASALLSEKDPFAREGESRGVASGSVDLLSKIRALDEFERHGRTQSPAGMLHSAAARAILRVRDQLIRSARGKERWNERHSADWESGLAISFLCAFPDRLARRRDSDSALGVMVGGIGVRLPHSDSLHGAELFLCLDVDTGGLFRRAAASGKEHRVRLALAVERSDLPSDRISSKVEVQFDDSKKRVYAIRRIRFLDLVLEESPTSIQDEMESARILAAAAANDLSGSLPLDEKGVANFLARVRWLGRANPQWEMPTFDRDQMASILEQICIEKKSFAELKQAPILEFLKAALTNEQRFRLDREAPERWTVPSGQSLLIRYQDEQTPVLAGRIQQFFGMRETPRIAGGRVKVLLHLLAPNMRPQQVTDDLESFWENIYPKIRKELRQRYPRHKWPEDGRVLPGK